MAYRKVESNIFKKMLQSRLLQFIIVILIGMLAVQVYEQYHNASMTQIRREQSEQEFHQRELDRQLIAEQVDALSDSYAIEAEIRRYFDVAKIGEEVVIILDPPPDTPISTTEYPGETNNTRPWYKFW